MASSLTNKTLAKACELNMRQWYCLKQTQNSGEIFNNKGLLWTRSPTESLYHGLGIQMLFPQFKKEDGNALLRRALKFYKSKHISPWATCGQASTKRHVYQALRSWGFVFRFLNIGLACKKKSFKKCSKRQEGLKIETLKSFDIFIGDEHPTFGSMENKRTQTAISVNLELAQKYPDQIFNFVAILNGEPVGYIMLNISDGAAGLYDLGVLKSARRSNVGSLLFSYACQRAYELGFKKTILQTHPGLLRFFERFGFSHVTNIEYWNCSKQHLDEFLSSPKKRKTIKSATAQPHEEFLKHVNLNDQTKAIRILKKNLDMANEPFPGTANIMPLHIAALNGQSELVQVLIDCGAYTESKDGNDEGTPLSWAIFGIGPKGPVIKQDQIGVIKCLVKAKANINATNKWNNTPLSLAVKTKNKQVQEILQMEKHSALL